MNFGKINNLLKAREHEVILISLCLVSIAFSFLNPLWYGQAPGFDASVFTVIGKMWANGEVLYRDMIDIKGPGIFFINMFGYRIGGYAGIAFIETLFLVFGVISLDLALRVFRFSPLSRFCSITVVLSLLGFRYYYGNMTEDYALYLAMMSSYPFAWLYYYRRFNWSIAMVPAILFALAVSIRLNNGAYFGAWYAMLFLFYRSNKNFKDALLLALSAFIGLFIVWGGFGLYFYIEGVKELVSDALYYSILIFFQNGSYGNEGFNIFAGLVGFFRTGLWIVVIGFTLLLNSKDNNLIINAKYNDKFWFLLYLTFGLVFTLIANSVSGHIYDHYDQLFLPFMFIPLAFLMHSYLHVKQDIHISFLTIVFLLVFLVSEHLIWTWNHHEWALFDVFIHVIVDSLCALAVCVILFVVRRQVGIYRHNHTAFLCLSIGIAFLLGFNAITLGHQNGKVWDSATAEKVHIIASETELNDKIWVEGDMPQYYIWTDRTAAAPYLFFSNVNPSYDVKQKVLNGIMYFHPKFIVIKTRLLDDFTNSKNKEQDFSRSEIAFYNYVFSNYTQPVKGLFKIKQATPSPAVVVNNTQVNSTMVDNKTAKKDVEVDKTNIKIEENVGVVANPVVEGQVVDAVTMNAPVDSANKEVISSEDQLKGKNVELDKTSSTPVTSDKDTKTENQVSNDGAQNNENTTSEPEEIILK